MSIVVIADIVGSRLLADRAAAQRALEESIARAQRDRPFARSPLVPTVGDELQAEYETLEHALAGLLLVQLALPDDIECRFGIGIGATTTVPSTAGVLQDGPGWWAARSALEMLDTLERRRAPRARTWIVGAAEHDEHMRIPVANAYLLARDQLVGAMSERVRRLCYGRCAGVSQKELARREGITQSAVSQLLSTAGAPAVIAGFEALTSAITGPITGSLTSSRRTGEASA